MTGILEHEQLPDGGFPSLSAPHKDDFSKAVVYRTAFFGSNILSCLNTVTRSAVFYDRYFPALGVIRRRAAGFLILQKSPGWSLNYWSQSADERNTMPYPDDLDDTFVALAALYGYDPKIIDGTVLADVAKILTSVEVKEGGPYRTWLVSASADEGLRDVDIVVNSNVGYFLSLLGVELPNLRLLIEDALADGKFVSPYYPSVIQVAYFVSRFYKSGKCSREIAGLVLAERTARALNPLETAMLASLLIELGFADEIDSEDIEVLTRLAESGEWKPYAFCIDPSRDGKTYYAGSAALTAAFVGEALVKYSAWQASRNRGDVEIKEIASPDILEKIKSLAGDYANTLPENLKRVVLAQIEGTVDKEIVMVPYRVQQALGKRGENLPAELLENLALANLYGWMAYTIYDDFLDGEGELLLLSAANYFLRELTLIYSGQGSAVLQFYKNLTNIIDDANIWEQLRCCLTVRNGIAELPAELPYCTVSNLADRSIGHALPAVVLLLKAGCAVDSPEIKQLLSFFRNYLIARQLHDDAHDWKEDLLRGQLNSVGARLLQSWRSQNPCEVLDLEKAVPDLQRLFWHIEIEGVIADIRSHLAMARASLGQLKIFENPKKLEELLEKLEKAAERTLNERAIAIDFLKEYSK